ncbi:MAG: ABC transporter permease [Sphingomonas sp.]|nr:ABC transporter permease [Sphingomonas sp.]
MNSPILLVAAREFRQIAATRGFWVTLLIIPIALAVAPITAHFMQKDHTENVMLIDPSGQAAPAIAARIELDHQRQLLQSLSRYAESHDLDRADPRAVWAHHDHYYSDAEVQAFVAGGGVKHADAVMRRVAAPDTKPFEAPESDYKIVPTPARLATSDPAALGRVLPAMVSHATKDPAAQPIDYAIYIPADFASGRAPVQIWSDGPVAGDLMGVLQETLTRAMRLHFLEEQGVRSEMAAAAQQIAPMIAVNRPSPGKGHEQVMIRSILPLLVSYLLFMSLMLSGSWMLQGTVEERSNKLIEAVLACVSPAQFMYGKLIGTIAVGLTMVAVWVFAATAAAFATQGMIADILRPALEPLTQPSVALAMIYYFLAGYVMISMIFLTIGAMSDSFRDAQAYLSPVMLVIAVPFAIIAQMVVRDPSSIGVRIMSWIPIYAPFTMLARLGAGVPLWEVVGSGLTLAAFIAIEVVLLGRVFRASLLGAGSKPSLAHIGRLMRGRERE